MYSRRTFYFCIALIFSIFLTVYISLVSQIRRSANVQSPDNLNAQAACNTALFDITGQPSGHSMAKQCVQANGAMYAGDSRFVFFDPPGGSGVLPKGYPFVFGENSGIKDLTNFNWSITVHSNANVYVYYRRAIAPSSETIPAWLKNGWSTTTGTAAINTGNLPSYLLRKNDQGLIGLYDVYQRTASNGTVINFGPAGDIPGVSPLSMYLVAVAGDAQPTTSATSQPTAPPSGSVSFVGAGNIASCGGKAESTAAMVKPIFEAGGYVFGAGDNAYASGGSYSAGGCFDKTWGQFKDRMYPVVGTHEISDGIEGYYNYFGQRIRGPAGKGYYSYDIGAWHWVSINSDLTGSDASAQLTWLQSDLAAHHNACIGAIQHRARFTTGSGGDQADQAPYWNALYDAGAEISIAAHKPYYERTFPVDKNRAIDNARGITNFVVGTGGNVGSVYDEKPGPIRASFQVGSSKGFWGILKLTLKSNGYDFTFTTASNSPNSAFSDSGSAQCH